MTWERAHQLRHLDPALGQQLAPPATVPLRTPCTRALDLAGPPHDLGEQCQVDYARARDWLRMHAPGERRSLAIKVLQNLDRPSKWAFDHVFERQVRALQARWCAERPMVAVNEKVSGRSNAWMTDRARRLMQRRTPLWSGQAGDLRGKAIDLVAFDDASYSGCQLGGVVTTALAKWDLGQVRNFYIVVPATTRWARKSVELSGCGRVRFLGPTLRLRVLHELQDSGALSRRDLRLLGADDDVTLAFVPHRIPDSVSCLKRILAQGECVDSHEATFGQVMPFIESIARPYGGDKLAKPPKPS